MSTATDILVHLKYQLTLWKWIGVIRPKILKEFEIVFFIHFIGDLIFLPTLVIGYIFSQSVQEIFLGLAYTIPIICIFVRMIFACINYQHILETSNLFEILNKRAEGLYKFLYLTLRYFQISFHFNIVLLNFR